MLSLPIAIAPYLEETTPKRDRASHTAMIVKGADFSYANLAGADLRGRTFDRVNFSYANLEGANLQDADLSTANLKGANLHSANLKGTLLPYIS